jgi:hypothetical protein
MNPCNSQFLSPEQVKKLTRRIGTLVGLARMLRVEPSPRWSKTGRAEVSILGELAEVEALGRTILSGKLEEDLATMLVKFDARFEASVRCTFWHVDSLEAMELRVEGISPERRPPEPPEDFDE